MLNFLASPSKTNRSPVMSRTSNRLRVPLILWCGMPLTRGGPLSLVAQMVGKLFPFRTNSVQVDARSVARSFGIDRLNISMQAV